MFSDSSRLRGAESGVDLTITETPAVIPEPSSLLLVGTGLLGALGAIRRKINL